MKGVIVVLRHKPRCSRITAPDAHGTPFPWRRVLLKWAQVPEGSTWSNEWPHPGSPGVVHGGKEDVESDGREKDS